IRGSYKLIDPENRLYECLLEYVKFATKNEEPSHVLPFGVFALHKPLDCVAFQSSLSRLMTKPSQFAYARVGTIMPLSSHYKQDKNQWGIDIRFTNNELALNLLPHGFSHILFGTVSSNGKQNTFVKFEPNCLGNFVEATVHGVDFVHGGS